MKLVQHIPTFVDGAPGRVIEFQKLGELLADPWIQSLQYNEDAVARPFHRFSLADRDKLMIERNGGNWWWVIGFIRDGDPASLGLPAWTHP